MIGYVCIKSKFDVPIDRNFSEAPLPNLQYLGIRETHHSCCSKL